MKEVKTPVVDIDRDEVLEIEKLQFKSNRFYIILALLFTALIIGLPSWILTTSVERAQLPIEEISQLNSKYLNNITYQIPVKIIDLPSPLDGIVDEAQGLLNDKLKDSSVKIKLFGSNDSVENSYELKIIMNEETDALFISSNADRLIKLLITPETIKYNVICELISRALIDTVFQTEITKVNSETKARKIIEFPFNTNYKLSINFLHSGSKMLDFEEKDENSLNKAMKNFQSFLNTLSPYANFTIEQQEMWFEKRVKTEGEFVENGTIHIKDTSMFIDYSEWGLDQDVEMDPIINLNVYLPENEKIIIEGSNKNSFLIPQWGGVVVCNEDETLGYDQLNEIFDIFAFQILKFLGIDTNSDISLFYRIDEKIRMQTVENINESLENYQSLLKLINQLETIPIPLQTVEEINESIRKVHETITAFNELNWLKAYEASNQALKLSNIAFFHKDMLSQAYFPEEHKMAVYSPLLGPFITIVTLSLIRAIKEIRS